MSGKIKFNIAEAQNISLELKIAAGRYTQETEELLKSAEKIIVYVIKTKMSLNRGGE